MKFLENYGMSAKEVEQVTANITPSILEALKNNYKLVQTNIVFLQNLGVKNLSEIFMQYYDMFLMDASNFAEIFNRYDREDLVEKIVKNVAIVEYL